MCGAATGSKRNVPVNFGFNSDVRLASQVCHVQTEEHGPHRPIIDTVVYLGGRVLHRRSCNYEDLVVSPDFSEEALRERVEEQHRAVIEDLRAGLIALDLRARPPASGLPASGIQVRLLNPTTWLAAGTVTLDIEVLSPADHRPLAGADLVVALEGTHGPIRFTGKSDRQGRARLVFPMPRVGPGGTELVIQAAVEGEEDEVRYTLRSSVKPPALGESR